MKKIRIFLIVFLGICLLIVGITGKRVTTSLAITGGDEVLNPQRDFTLHDQEGKIFRLKDHRGEVILLFFGYTSCPDVCPTTLSKLARVYRLLGEKMRQKVLTVFVTVDPQRDTSQKLKEYLQYFNINAMGLTGTIQEIDVVVAAYKASYIKVIPNSSALGYMYDHTDILYLIDTQGKTAHLFHPEDNAQDMAQIIRVIARNEVTKQSF